MEVKLIGYRVVGEVDGYTWMGHFGTMEMDAYQIDEPTREKILAGLNDGRFGMESIIAARCIIYEMYELGARRVHSEIEFDDPAELSKVKRGI